MCFKFLTSCFQTKQNVTFSAVILHYNRYEFLDASTIFIKVEFSMKL